MIRNGPARTDERANPIRNARIPTKNPVWTRIGSLPIALSPNRRIHRVPSQSPYFEPDRFISYNILYILKMQIGLPYDERKDSRDTVIVLEFSVIPENVTSFFSFSFPYHRNNEKIRKHKYGNNVNKLHYRNEQ